MGKKREGIRYALIGGCWHREAAGWLTRSGVSCDCLGMHIWLSLVGPKLEAGQKLGKLLVINQVLPILGQLL